MSIGEMLFWVLVTVNGVLIFYNFMGLRNVRKLHDSATENLDEIADLRKEAANVLSTVQQLLRAIKTNTKVNKNDLN